MQVEMYFACQKRGKVMKEMVINGYKVMKEMVITNGRRKQITCYKLYKCIINLVLKIVHVSLPSDSNYLVCLISLDIKKNTLNTFNFFTL